MTSPEKELRYEVKMTCKEDALPRLHSALQLHPSVIRPLYPSRVVQSIYFDTHSGRSLSDNLAGLSERQKTRLRWYGEATTGVHGTLERKERFNQLGSKTTYTLPTPITLEGVPRSQLLTHLLPHCDGFWREQLAQGLEPAQWIRYRRAYYISADQLVRITVDTELAAFDLRFRADIGCDQPSVLPRICVVECKASSTEHTALERVVRALPLAPARCSKFVLASSPPHGPMTQLYQ